MRYLSFFLISITSLLMFQGCSFTEQSRNKSPYFDGVIKFNDEPIENARVMLSLNSKDTLCYKPVQTTTTNNLGQFSLIPAKVQTSYTPLLNYTFDEWVVCAEYKEQRYTLYSNNRYDLGNVSDSVYLDCDFVLRPLSKPCKASLNQ